MIKAFADIDVAFFDGRLRGNVVAVWASEEDILEKGCGEGKPERGCFMGLCQPIAPEENEGEPRCRVWLNSDAIFDAPDPRLQMWQTMLHELVVSRALFGSLLLSSIIKLVRLQMLQVT